MAADNPTLLRGNLMEGFLWVECSRRRRRVSAHTGSLQPPPTTTHWFSIYSDERVNYPRSIQVKCKILHKPCSDKHVGTFTLCTCRSRIYMERGGGGGSRWDFWARRTMLPGFWRLWYCFYISLKISPSISLPLAQAALASELVWLQAFTFSHTLVVPFLKKCLIQNRAVPNTRGAGQPCLFFFLYYSLS